MGWFKKDIARAFKRDPENNAAATEIHMGWFKKVVAPGFKRDPENNAAATGAASHGPESLWRKDQRTGAGVTGANDIAAVVNSRNLERMASVKAQLATDEVDGKAFSEVTAAVGRIIGDGLGKARASLANAHAQKMDALIIRRREQRVKILEKALDALSKEIRAGARFLANK